MKRSRNHVFKAMIFKKNCGNMDNKIEIVGYVTVLPATIYVLAMA